MLLKSVTKISARTAYAAVDGSAYAPGASARPDGARSAECRETAVVRSARRSDETVAAARGSARNETAAAAAARVGSSSR